STFAGAGGAAFGASATFTGSGAFGGSTFAGAGGAAFGASATFTGSGAFCGSTFAGAGSVAFGASATFTGSGAFCGSTFAGAGRVAFGASATFTGSGVFCGSTFAGAGGAAFATSIGWGAGVAALPSTEITTLLPTARTSYCEAPARATSTRPTLARASVNWEATTPATGPLPSWWPLMPVASAEER